MTDLDFAGRKCRCFPVTSFSMLCGFAILLSSCAETPHRNVKKVFADYHGVRYTRETDGQLGRWEMYASTKQSSTGCRSLCYNADLIDICGRHQIAAVHYPAVGMQSNLDEDYIEYQILSAKTAKIDGFFIEWGFLPHENDVLLRAMQTMAGKYDFEIGVNWCDGWLYYDWITRIYPEIDSREAKTGYMAECYRYLADSVYSVPTAAKVNGIPVFYHFGPGATPQEYSRLLAETSDLPRLTALRRWAEWGRIENDKYIPVCSSAGIDSWKALGEIPSPWIPARVRLRDAAYPLWDNYAVEDDLIEFMKPFRDSVWLSSDPSYTVKCGFAMPGMDNRGCAGWGRGHFFLIPRNGGATYEDMWKFCMESKDSLDMMFIASWSDYTEGHEIEPTIENGDRELRTTLKYAAEFKGESFNPDGLDLPPELFRLRKNQEFLSSCDIDGHFVSALDNAKNLADRAGMEISCGKYRRAKRHIASLRRILEDISSSLEKETIVLDGFDRGDICLDENFVARLEQFHYTGFISFDYKDDGEEFLFVRSETDREPPADFSIVGKLRTDETGEWKHARICLYDRNIVYRKGTQSFIFSGNVDVRNIKLEYEIFRFPDPTASDHRY